MQIAMQQSAWETNCSPDDFLKDENVITISEPNPNAVQYYNLPLSCNLISYGSNIVATIYKEYKSSMLCVVKHQIRKKCNSKRIKTCMG